MAQRDWERSPRLVRAVTRDSIWLVVEWLDGEISQCGFWSFDPLPAIWNGSAETRVRRVDGGACVAWLSEDGSDAFRIHAAELWAARE